MKEKESILKAYDTCLHNNKILCEAVKELLKPDADTVKVSRKLGGNKMFEMICNGFVGVAIAFCFLKSQAGWITSIEILLACILFMLLRIHMLLWKGLNK